MAKIGHNPINTNLKQKRSDLGVELVRLLSREGLRIFSIEQAREFAPCIGIKNAYLAEALYHLRQTGWIVALRRGLYAIASAVPGVPPPHEFEIATSLISPAAISHWSALHHHGLTDQPPRSVFVLTTTGTSLPRRRRTSSAKPAEGFAIAGVEYRFIQVKANHFFGVEKIWLGETRIPMTDPERSLLDGLSMPQYCGDFAEVLHAFQARAGKLDLRRIVEYGKRFDAATAKRLGWVLDRQGIDSSEVQPLLEIPMKGFRRLDPTGPRRGPYDKRWMIQENLPGRIDA